MRCLFLIACCALALAAEDARAQAKSVWQAAFKAGDAWTCLQAEAWARGQKPALRLGPALGETTVIGDPLFSFPANIRIMADHGERVVVVAAGRAWVLAGDGRPLQPSVRLDAGHNHVIGCAGRAVLTVDAAGDGNWRLSAVRLGDGVRTLNATYKPVGEQVRTGMVVAEDGSAAAIEVQTEDGATGRIVRSLLLAVGEKPLRPLDLSAPQGIGRGGSWLIAGNVVQCGERRIKTLASVAGPGLAAFIAEGKATLVLIDGRQAALAGGPVIGNNPGLAMVGDWLVLSSGHGAKMESQIDLLGDGGSTMTEQPPTLAFWRWADLAADPAAKPVTTLPGHLSVATDHPAALWSWQGTKLSRIVLSGDKPEVVPHIEAENVINWASNSLHCVHLDHANGQRSLYGPDTKELWHGPAAQLEAVRWNLALVERVTEDRLTWALAALSPDPGKRREVQLQIPEQRQWLIVSRRPPDLVVARGERNWWRSVGFDGKVIATARDNGPNAQPAPRCHPWSWSNPKGRFLYSGARALLKAEAPASDPLAEFEPNDAWRVGSATILLDNSGRVLVSGRKRGEWIDLPAVAAGDRFGMLKNEPVVVTDNELRTVAVLAPGPKLEARDGGTASDLAGGPWRIERNWCFTPPRGRQLEWDEDRLGWRPVRLRSPGGSGLFIVMPTLLIELDPAGARMFGR